LDNLHLVLFQIILFFTFRSFTSYKKRPALKVTSEPIKDPPVSIKKLKAERVKAKKSRQHAVFNGNLLDSTLRQFLDITSPLHSSLIKNSTPSEFEPISLSEWEEVFRSEDEDLVVSRHPKQTAMYAICTKYPGLDFRKLAEALRRVELYVALILYGIAPSLD
jgi:hypothetical protein